MGRERRRVARVDANLFAEVELASGEIIGRGVVTDVSLGGIALETEADIPVNSQVVCFIEIPLQLKATVVRRAISSDAVRQYGLKFDSPSIIEKFVIRRVLKGSRRTRKVDL